MRSPFRRPPEDPYSHLSRWTQATGSERDRDGTSPGRTDMNARGWLLAAALLLGWIAPLTAQTERVTVYGFFDVELHTTNQRGGPPWSFSQHRLNVISIYRLDEEWRVFAEIGWEHGTSLQGGGGSGAVAIMRAALEYKRTDAFQAKAGKFLPPFGLYNVRHDASPTFLSTGLPSSIYGEHPDPLGEERILIPEFGTGIQVLGRVAANGWRGEYFVYLSNGRGPAPAEQDNNQDKGVGGRLVIGVPGGAGQLGASYYTDRNGDAANTRQRIIGLDVTARFADFYLEAEAFAPRLERVDPVGRPNGGFRTGRGYYLQLSRPLGQALTPFARYDFYDSDTRATGDAERDVVMGLNIAATRAVFLKGQVHLRSFQDPARESYQQFVSSVAVAF